MVVHVASVLPHRSHDGANRLLLGGVGFFQSFTSTFGKGTHTLGAFAEGKIELDKVTLKEGRSKKDYRIAPSFKATTTISREIVVKAYTAETVTRIL